MAPPPALARSVSLAAALLVGGGATFGAARRLPTPHQPGFGLVEYRERHQCRLRLDRDADVALEEIAGRTVILRRRVHQVFLPQSWRPLAEHWEEVGVGRLLAVDKAGGALVAHLIWENEQAPVKPGDRVELCRVPTGAAKPVLLSLRCRTPREVGEADGATVVPGDEVCLEADLFCPTLDRPHCRWATDTGEFVHAGGRPGGTTVRGPAQVRWRPVATALTDREAKGEARIRLVASAGPRGAATEHTITIRVAAPKGRYAKVREVSPRRTPYRDVGPVAAGPLGSFTLADPAAGQLVHWTPGGARSAALDTSGVQAISPSPEGVLVLKGSALLRWQPGADEATQVASLPVAARLADAAFNAAGDLYLVESAGVSRVRLLARGPGQVWREQPMEPPIASPGLRRICVDPLSNDLYVFDAQDLLLRRWRARAAHRYTLHGPPMALDKAVDKHGALAAVVPRRHATADESPPIHLVFESGAVTARWSLEGEGARWSAVAVRAPAPLPDVGFAAHHAAALGDGDLLLAGRGTVDGEARPILAQVSTDGELRRMLPIPPLTPRALAVGPDGRRFVLLTDGGWGSRTERLVVLGPAGWLVRDLGTPRNCRSIVAVRPDRASPDHVLLVGECRGRQSAFRLDATDPSLCLELSSAGMPTGRIPDHRAVDAASSPKHLVVLDRDGKVLLFANRRPVAYLGHFETGLRRPQAVAVLSDVTPAGERSTARQSLVCVLASGGEGPCVHVWDIRTPAGHSPAATRLGSFPDDGRAPAAARLSKPVTMESGFPNHQERLFVLDRGGAQVRSYDVAAIAAALAQGRAPDVAAPPVLGDLPARGEAMDLAIGPGQVVHIADPEALSITTYAREPAP